MILFKKKIEREARRLLMEREREAAIRAEVRRILTLVAKDLTVEEHKAERKN